ncbi:formyltransferase family protein [Akkermansiaceae bacterium]|nr:formyltransferase family protein [Akkermansiaceae bacterium]
MKIACITYRIWAERIYFRLVEKYPQHTFLVWVKRKEYDEAELKKFNPDLILWFGWSWLIEDYFTTKYTSIMLHPSPLPKYRGGSPIQNQIINGERFSAVTLFRITNDLDAGDIFVQEPIVLDGDIDVIFDAISNAGYQATCRVIEGDYTLKKQDPDKATFCKRRKESESEITSDELRNASGEYLYNKIRMLTGPYPRAFIRTNDNQKLYIEQASLGNAPRTQPKEI